MRLQQLFLYAGGILTIVVAIMHLSLPAIWGWYKELKNLTPRARKTILDRNSFLILLLLIIAYMTFALNEDMQVTETGRALLLLLGLYWILRALWRVIGYPKGGLTYTVAIIYFVTGICFLVPLMP